MAVAKPGLAKGVAREPEREVVAEAVSVVAYWRSLPATRPSPPVPSSSCLSYRSSFRLPWLSFQESLANRPGGQPTARCWMGGAVFVLRCTSCQKLTRYRSTCCMRTCKVTRTAPIPHTAQRSTASSSPGATACSTRGTASSRSGPSPGWMRRARRVHNTGPQPSASA